MSLRISGFDEIQNTLSEASEALSALDGELAVLKFNSEDHFSVEAAIRQMEESIDMRLAPYQGNDIVKGIVAQMKENYREHILDMVAEARIKNTVEGADTLAIDPSELRQIENAVMDLRRADYNSFGRHIKKLSKLLHSDRLDTFTRQLTAGIDLNAWLEAGHSTQGSMVGSAVLEWPTNIKDELGTVVLLIDRFAENPDQAFAFSHTFYYSGGDFTTNLQSMAAQIIVPFCRDYIDYIKTQTGIVEDTTLPPKIGPAARKVFIVHGHDDGAREAVARFLEKLGFEAIILHEQVSQGRTIIEKIEAHGEVGFAVVLLTPDDVGGVVEGEAKPRARQNVILELGYFIGRLGRSRVCALRRGNVELPSDFGGVVYETFDASGGWKAALGKELSAAGFEIDWNLVMRP
jgi:hypothetical protein